MAGLFTNNGANLGPAGNAFFRSDTTTGLSNDPSAYTAAAVNELLGAINSGQATASSPQAQALLQALQGGTATVNDIIGLNNGDQSGIAAYLPTAPNNLGGTAGQVFGTIPGTPVGSQPTVQLRSLLQQSLDADRNAALAEQQFQYSMTSGDRAAALAAKAQADQFTIQSRQLDQAASQFAQTFGLQKEDTEARIEMAKQQLAEQQTEFATGQTGLFNGAPTQAAIRQQADIAAQQASLTGVLNGQETLAGRNQAVQEAQYASNLGAHPENLIEYALYQGARTPGGIPVPPQSATGTPLDQSLAAQQHAVAGTAPATAGAVDPNAALNTAIGNQQNSLVPVPGVLDALLHRAYVPGYGATAGTGSLVPLSQLQNDPSLRVSPGNLDLASLNNLSQPEQSNLLSVLQAQGQDVNAFKKALTDAKAGQNASNVSSTF